MKKEHGRSMVEMLGTLAIIGVLSVTALTGYKIAMTKNRTNNILYDVNLAMNEIATREYLSLPEITQHVRDLGVRTELDIVYARNGGTESSGFFIQVNGVTEDVCKTLTSNKTAFMSSIQPYSGNAEANACAEGIDVRAIFPYPPVEGGEVGEPIACPENSTLQPGGWCKCNIGYYNANTTGADSPSKIQCEPTECTDAECCASLELESGEYYAWNGEQCVNCGSDTNGRTENGLCACENDFYNGEHSRKPDGSCCPMFSVWNGEKCVNCAHQDNITSDGKCNCDVDSGYYVSTPDGGCCGLSGYMGAMYGYNGQECVFCAHGVDEKLVLGTGGSIETACNCSAVGLVKNTITGGCCMSGYGFDGSKCVTCSNGIAADGTCNP